MPAIITGNQTGTVGLINTGTVKNTTSGTAIEYTGLPTGLTRITVMLYGVSIDQNSVSLLIQIGSGSFATSGYNSASGGIAGATGFSTTPSTAGFIIAIFEAANEIYGSLTLTRLGGNVWVASGNCESINLGSYHISFMNSGGITLGGVCDRVRLTTTSGTANFDNGSINILYE